MHEHIFAGLTLDEPVTLRSIELLHRALFLHLHYLVNENCFASLGPSAWYSGGSDAQAPRLPPARKKKAAKFVLAAPRTSQKVIQEQKTLVINYHKTEGLSTQNHTQRTIGDIF